MILSCMEVCDLASTGISTSASTLSCKSLAIRKAFDFDLDIIVRGRGRKEAILRSLLSLEDST